MNVARFIGIAVCLTAVSAAAHAQQTKPRLFPPQDLGLLEAPDRDEWNQPARVMDALNIAEASIVADLGAGGGWFTVRLSRRVGPNGVVYAEDIQQQMIDAIDRRVEREGLTNVRSILGTADDPRLPPGLDAALIVDAYHEMEDPVTLLQRVGQALKPQGRLGIVEFIAGGGGPGPAPSERVDPRTVIATADAAGLRLISSETISPFMYLLVFGRAPVSGTSR